MISLQTADNALKDVYLGVVSDQLNTSINPLFAKIKQTTSDVWGNNIVKVAPFGVNGGIGAGSETGELPIAGGNNYEKFTLELKNLYGKIEISDKAIRASMNSAGAFVNLLNAEMEDEALWKVDVTICEGYGFANMFDEHIWEEDYLIPRLNKILEK